MGKKGRKAKGILKKKGSMTEAEQVAIKKLKTVRFSFKTNVHTQLQVLGDSELTDKDLRRSPRVQKRLKGYKDKESRIQAEQGGMESGPTNLKQPSAEGNMLFHFPGPVKFPTLTELENGQNTYPIIPANVLQAVAIQECSVPPEEVTLEQLEAPSTAEAGGKGSSSMVATIVNHE